MKIYKMSTERWSIQRLLYLIGGFFVLGSVILGFLVSENFFFFAGFVGLMQITFALSGYCPMAIFLSLFRKDEK